MRNRLEVLGLASANNFQEFLAPRASPKQNLFFAGEMREGRQARTRSSGFPPLTNDVFLLPPVRRRARDFGRSFRFEEQPAEAILPSSLRVGCNCSTERIA
jgi:hypothetical protein